MKNRKRQRGYTAYELFVVVLILYILTAWVVNIVKLVDLDFEAPYKAEVVRVISIIPVISAVTAFMDIGEENNEQNCAWHLKGHPFSYPLYDSANQWNEQQV